MKPKIHVIVAVDRSGAIGRAGDLIYRLKADLKRFKAITMGNTLVMGRRTWESLPGPLPGRRSIVVTRQPDYKAEGAEIAPSLDAAIAMGADGPGEIFIIGGAQLYNAVIPQADVLHLTAIDAEAEDADTFLEPIPDNIFEIVEEEDAGTEPPAKFVTMQRKK